MQPLVFGADSQELAPFAAGRIVVVDEGQKLVAFVVWIDIAAERQVNIAVVGRKRKSERVIAVAHLEVAIILIIKNELILAIAVQVTRAERLLMLG